MTHLDPFPPDRSPDPAIALEAKVNAIMQGLLAMIIRHYAPEGVSEPQVVIRAFEVVRDAMRMEPEADAE